MFGVVSRGLLPVRLVMILTLRLLATVTEACDDATEFQCTVTRGCIGNWLLCDNYDNCGDNSDEKDCPCYSRVDFRAVLIGTVNNPSNSTTLRSVMVKLYGDPGEYVGKLNSESDGNCLLVHRNHIGYFASDSVHSVAVRYSTQMVFFTDNYLGTINFAPFVYNNQTYSTYYYAPPRSRQKGGISFDWASKSLYWVDREEKSIGMFPTEGYVGRVWKSVVVDLDAPADVAVNPLNFYLFWSDGTGANAKIERSDLSGNNRVVLLNSTQGLVAPTTLVVDFTSSQRLYWLDAAASTLGAVNFDGSNVMTWNRSEFTNFSSMTLHTNYIYFGDSRNPKIYIYDKPTVSFITSYTLTSVAGRVTDLLMYYPQMQPSATSPCSMGNGGCSQLCFTTSTTTRICDCMNGFFLGSDAVTCITRPFLQSVPFLLVADNSHQIIFQLQPDTGELRGIQLPNRQISPISLTFDTDTNIVYFTCEDNGDTDIYKQRIRKKSLYGTADNPIYIAPSVNSLLSGIALDGGRGLLYYTDKNGGVIAEIRTDGSERREIFNTPSERPTSLAVDPINRRLYWTDCSTSPTIQTARVDGIDRRVLIGGKTASCFTAIVIDVCSELMYWTVDSPPAVEMSLLNGTGRRTLFTQNMSTHNPQYTGIALLGNALYITDSYSRYVIKLNLSTYETSVQRPGVFGNATNIVYPQRYQCEATLANATTQMSSSQSSTPSSSRPDQLALIVGIVVGVGGFVLICVIVTVVACALVYTKRSRTTDTNNNNDGVQPAVPSSNDDGYEEIVSTHNYTRSSSINTASTDCPCPECDYNTGTLAATDAGSINGIPLEIQAYTGQLEPNPTYKSMDERVAHEYDNNNMLFSTRC